LNPKTKLAIRRLTLRSLRKLLDLADEQLHAAEVRLREELGSSPLLELAVLHGRAAGETESAMLAQRKELAKRHPQKRRRGVTSSAFDLRFSGG